VTDSPKVTAEERANWAKECDHGPWIICLDCLIAQIKSAEEAARAEGFADAQGQAAKAIANYSEPEWDEGEALKRIAERIRALKPQSGAGL
jgi:hypothetical protein